MAEEFDETLIDQLVMLGYDREQCIKASTLVTNYKDINELQDKLTEMENQQTQQQYNIDEQKQLDPYKIWKCDTCSTTNILYKSICKLCQNPCKNIKDQIELNIKHMIKILLPTWSKIDNHNIKLQKVSNALSSKLYIVSNIDIQNNATQLTKFIFRIYNPNTINNTHSEIQYLFSNKLEIGPKLICKIGNFGQLEEYLDSRQTDRIKDLYHNESIYKSVAKYIAQIHSSNLTTADSTKSNVTHGWVNAILTNQSNKLKDIKNRNKFKWFTDIIGKYYGENKATKDVNMTQFVDIEVKWLLSLMKQYSYDLCYRSLKDLDKNENEKRFANTTDIVFCHNDLNHRNILLINKNVDMDDNKLNDNNNSDVRIIDYEYSGYCNRFWDFGHYFCEIAINACLDPPQYFKINIPQEYPDIKYRTCFVKYYLNEILRIKLNVNSLKDIAVINDKYINLMVNTIEYGVLWIHIITIMWAFGEWQNNKGKEVGFDFKRYVTERIHCYFQQKDKICKQ
eukprot:418580_1